MTRPMTLDPRRLARAAALTAAALLALSGCASIRRHEAADTEDLLAAAGFQRREADQPSRQQDLASMPPYKVVERSKDGKVIYTFADPEHCHCVYVGGPKEYAEYRHLLMDREVARETDDAALNWEAWGPWWW